MDRKGNIARKPRKNVNVDSLPEYNISLVEKDDGTTHLVQVHDQVVPIEDDLRRASTRAEMPKLNWKRSKLRPCLQRAQDPRLLLTRRQSDIKVEPDETGGLLHGE